MKPRYFVLILLRFVIFSASAQTAGALTSTFQVPDCRALSLAAADEIAAGMEKWNIERIDSAIASVTVPCGYSEVMLRMRILATIMKREDPSSDVREYFDNRYHDRTIDRVSASTSSDYSYLYTNREGWYGYVPLRHPVDSLSGNVAIELMDVRKLTPDEHLLCLLFTGDVVGFETAWAGREAKNSYARTYRRNLYTDRGRSRRGSVVFYSGVYSPIGDRKVFGPNPTFGITISSSVERLVTIEVGGKVRFLVDDQPFKYYAMNKVNEVDSKMGFFFGAIGGFKLYDKKNFIVQSRVGLGLEQIGTGLSEPSKNPPANDPDQRKYYDLSTLHTSLGLAAMKGLPNGAYIGVEAGFHACPYGFDKNLKTPMDNLAASGEVFFRF